jgi:hypothetical protein
MREGQRRLIGDIRTGADGWQGLVRGQNPFVFRSKAGEAIELGGTEQEVGPLNQAMALMSVIGNAASSGAQGAPPSLATWKKIGGMAGLALVPALLARMKQTAAS